MYEVEWVSHVPEDECGDLLLDEADSHTKYFKSREKALSYAKTVYPRDFFGSVRVTECHHEPYELGSPVGYIEGYIEYDGDSEYVDDQP